MDRSSIDQIVQHGVKRRAELVEDLPRKRLQAIATGIDQTVHEVDSDALSSDNENSTIATNATNVTTPSTPFTPASSHKHPSDIHKIHVCTYDSCDKAFNRPAKLAQHIRSHTNDRPFACPYHACGKDFLRDSHLRHHIKSAHTSEREYICNWEGCQKRFLTATRLKRHIAGHEGHVHLTCHVDGCGQIFRKHSTLNAHVQKDHEGQKPHVCLFLEQSEKMCGMGFDTAAQLRSHQGRIHRRKIFTCTICSPQENTDIDHAFTTYQDLQRHMALEHPPTCSHCGLACVSQAALKSHLEIYHTESTLDERRIEMCPEAGCSASFTKRGNLNAHIRSVHNSQRYVCGKSDVQTNRQIREWNGNSSCGAGFSSRSDLIEHIRTQHIGLEPKATGKAKRKAREARMTASAKITGVYDDSKNTAPRTCPVPSCGLSFHTEHDEEFHLRDAHGFIDGEVSRAVTMARQGLQGSQFFASPEDLEAERFLDLEEGYGLMDLDADQRGDADDEAPFWTGQDHNIDPINQEEWTREELEMRQLIDDTEELGYGDGCSKMDLDPLLKIN